MNSMSTKGTVGVAVLGCGDISHPHFEGWQRLAKAGQVRLEAACDSDLSRAKCAAERYGAARADTDLEAVVQRPEVQAVDICLPHHLHLPAILAAARAGKHVLCEKPMVLNLDEAAKAIRACHEAKVVLMTANRDRFEPHARAVKRILDLGMLGKVNLVSDRYLLNKNVVNLSKLHNMAWKLSKQTSGGGVLHREGCYYIDSLLYWEGSGVARVTGAEFGDFLWETREIETAAHVLFRFRSGAIGVYEMTWCFQGPHIREVVINGSEGSLRMSGAVGEDAVIEVHSRRAQPRILDDPAVVQAFEDCYGRRPDETHPDRAGESLVLRVPYAHGFYAEEKEFLSAIREGRAPESSGLQGALALEVVEGAYRCALERRAIEFPLVDWVSVTGG